MRESEAYGINGEKKNTEGKKQNLFVALLDWMKQSLLKKKRISEEKEGTSRRPKKQEKGRRRNGEEKREEKGKNSLFFL